MSKMHRYVLSILASIVVWQVINAMIIEIPLGDFLLIEMLFAMSELFIKFVIAHNKVKSEISKNVIDAPQQEDVEL